MRKSKWMRLRPHRDNTETTRQYTPQDHRALLAEKGNGQGIIRPNTSDLHLPDNLEAIGEGSQANQPPRVVLVITIAALVFIAIITYFVSQMPKKD